MMTRTKLTIAAGAAALALSACGGVAATPGQTVHHRASHFSAHPNQAATNATYEADVVKAKRDLWRRLAQRAGGR
jgi:ABC-type glycerol-3-phosphate transport system substrate-binding protein